MSNEVIRDLAQGRCTLVLDCSNEGHPLVRAKIDYILEWARDHSIGKNRILIVSQNRALEKSFQETYPECSALIRFSVYDYFIKMIAHHFSLEEEKFAEILGFEASRITYESARTKTFSFLCLNATPRPMRIITMAALKKHGPSDATLSSFLGTEAGKGKLPTVEEIGRLLSRMPGFEDLLDGCVKILNAHQLG